LSIPVRIKKEAVMNQTKKRIIPILDTRIAFLTVGLNATYANRRKYIDTKKLALFIRLNAKGIFIRNANDAKSAGILAPYSVAKVLMPAFLSSFISIIAPIACNAENINEKRMN
jgi:hypothetical protein